MKLLGPSMFLVLSISFVATQTPAARDDVLAKAHDGAAERAGAVLAAARFLSEGLLNECEKGLAICARRKKTVGGVRSCSWLWIGLSGMKRSKSLSLADFWNSGLAVILSINRQRA